MSDRRQSEPCSHSPYGWVDHSQAAEGIVLVEVRCAYCGARYGLTADENDSQTVRVLLGPVGADKP